MSTFKGIFLLKGTVQHYEWGGYDFLPGLLGINNAEKKPYAEYWMGSHPKAPSHIIINGESRTMDTIVHLPFLFKAQDVREMLSIQVHPSKKAAELEFARENHERIPVDAPHRNYRDDNHKPELACALSEFRLLHGFKNEKLLQAVLDAVPEFAALSVLFRKDGYEALYKKVMGMPQEEVNEILYPLIDRIVPLYQQGALNKNEEDYWAARAALSFSRNGNADRGIFSIYFFNIVVLQPGEAIFQDAGIPHAYLEGQCMEIMANSDNVLRGGLTFKHVDVKELMKHVLCKPLVPSVLKGTPAGEFEKIFETPAPDFQLSEIRLPEKKFLDQKSVSDEILFLYSGKIEIQSEYGSRKLKRGEAAFVTGIDSYRLSAVENSVLYRAAVPHRLHE